MVWKLAGVFLKFWGLCGCGIDCGGLMVWTYGGFSGLGSLVVCLVTLGGFECAPGFCRSFI